MNARNIGMIISLVAMFVGLFYEKQAVVIASIFSVALAFFWGDNNER